MKWIFKLTFSLLPVAICSCGPSHGDTVYFDDIRTPYFSHEAIPLTDGDTLGIDFIGIHNIAVRGDMLFLSTTDTNGALKVIETNSLDSLGSFVSIGGGPGEFISIPELDQYSIISDSDSSATAAIPDFPRGVMHKLFLTVAGDTLRHDVTEIMRPKLKDFCISAKMIGNDKYLIENVNPENWSISYSYIDNGNSIPDDALNTINSGKVESPEYLGAIMTYPLLSNSLKAVAIINPSLSQINLFSLDNSFTPFTIAPDGRVESYRQLIDSRWPLEESYYSCGHGYDDFFAVSRTNKKDDISQITMYNWSGEIVSIYSVPATFTSFDFDTTNNRLYTFNLSDEAIIRYNLPAAGMR